MTVPPVMAVDVRFRLCIDSNTFLQPESISLLQGELAVAGVYVRVFNQQPNFPLADPAAFCKVITVLLCMCMPLRRMPVHAAADQCHADMQLTPILTSNLAARRSSQGLVMYINGSVKGHAAAAESSGTGDGGDEQVQRRRRHLAAALQALQHAIEGHPRLAMLMASRPALAPLLEVVERPCRCAPAVSAISAVPMSWPRRALSRGTLTRSHETCQKTLCDTSWVACTGGCMRWRWQLGRWSRQRIQWQGSRRRTRRRQQSWRWLCSSA
jgi:hypothetical protein